MGIRREKVHRMGMRTEKVHVVGMGKKKEYFLLLGVTVCIIPSSFSCEISGSS